MSSTESMATPTFCDFAFGSLVIGVEPHLGREIEGARQAGLAGGQQELEALVRRLG